MQKVRIVIGKFRRPMFGESLYRALSRHAEFSVHRAEATEDLRASTEGPGPTVVILDDAVGQIDRGARPRNRDVAIVRVTDEGREVDVMLHEIGPEHIHRLAALVCRSTAVLAAFAGALRSAVDRAAQRTAGGAQA